MTDPDAKDRIRRTESPGAPPGTITVEEGAPRPEIRLLGYGPEGCEEALLHTHADLVKITEFLRSYSVTWVNIDGLGDPKILEEIGRMFSIHPLVLEDVAHAHQRAKIESYGDYLFLVTRMVDARHDLDTEQLSLVLGANYALSFQEGIPGDCLHPVRERIRHNIGQIRTEGADYLAYTMLDAVVDNYFPVLEGYNLLLERFEDKILEGTGSSVVKRVHAIKRDLITLERSLFPLRAMLKSMRRDESPFFRPKTRIYLRDVYDHSVQLLDLVKSYRKIAVSLIDLQLSLASHRMNQVMKLLTVIGSIFLPLTFVTGLYGMNFDTTRSWNLPELRWKYGYITCLAVMFLITLGMLVYFYRKGWLTSED